MSSEQKEPIRLNLGCGSKKFPGYINVDANPQDNPDVLVESIMKLPFEDNYADEIRMDAVFEHLWRQEQIPAIREWQRVLKKDGKLIINWIPDFEIIAKLYVIGAKPGIVSPEFDLEEVFRYSHGGYDGFWDYRGLLQVHKDIFDSKSLTKIFQNAGGFKSINITRATYGNEPYPTNLMVEAIADKTTEENQKSAT